MQYHRHTLFSIKFSNKAGGSRKFSMYYHNMRYTQKARTVMVGEFEGVWFVGTGAVYHRF